MNFKNIDSLFLENKNKISPTLDLGKLYKNEEIKERKYKK